MHLRNIAVLLAIGCSLPLFVGCGEKLEVVEVTGTVKVKGKPLDMIHVEFWPDNGPRSWGVTDENGKFTLALDSEEPRTGAVPGNHKVMLKDKWPSKDDVQNDSGDWIDNSKGKRPRINSKYYDIIISDLSVNVKSGEANTIDIDADPR